MTAVVDAVTDVVPIEKLALKAPAGTVTVAGTVATLELDDRKTTAPSPRAAAFNVTVPVDELPATTLVGLTEIVDIATGPTVIEEKNVVSACVAESPTLRIVEAVNVEIVKLSLVAPAGIVILDGTLASDGASLASVTMSPSGGAGSGNVTVPVDGVPPATLFGFTVNDARVGLDGGVLGTATSRTNTSRLAFTSSGTKLLPFE
jgi:hypothetical protein